MSVLWGACTAPPCGVSYCPALQHFSNSEELCLQKQRCGEYKSLGIELRFICLGFIGPETFLGDWRKAVSRMAAPRGLTVDHP